MPAGKSRSFYVKKIFPNSVYRNLRYTVHNSGDGIFRLDTANEVQACRFFDLLLGDRGFYRSGLLGDENLRHSLHERRTFRGCTRYARMYIAGYNNSRYFSLYI
jgi:hypothetical protein